MPSLVPTGSAVTVFVKVQTTGQTGQDAGVLVPASLVQANLSIAAYSVRFSWD